MLTVGFSWEIPKDYTGECYGEVFGVLYWIKEGKFHRLDGPAVVRREDRKDRSELKEFWINGEMIQEEQFWKRSDVKMAVIGGKVNKIINEDI